MPPILPADFSVRQFKSVNVSVGTTSVQIDTAANVLPNFRLVALYNNNGSGKIYIGEASTVTTTSGYPILPSNFLVFSGENQDALKMWAVADNAASDLRVIFAR